MEGLVSGEVGCRFLYVLGYGKLDTVKLILLTLFVTADEGCVGEDSQYCMVEKAMVGVDNGQMWL